MGNQYSDVCKAFKAGVCYVDTVNKIVCYDSALAAIIGCNNPQLSYDEFINRLRPADKQIMCDILSSMPDFQCDEVRFTLCVADVNYLVHVIFNTSDNGKDVVGGFLRFDNHKTLSSQSDYEQINKGTQSNIISNLDGISRTGYARLDLLSLCGAATNVWYNNMGVSTDVSVEQALLGCDNYYDQDGDVIRDICDKIKRQEVTSVEKEIRIKEPNGNYRWVLVNAICTKFESSRNSIDTIWTTIDITKLKRIEKELVDINSQFDIVSHHMTVSQVYVDKNFVVQWGNTSLNPLFKKHPYIQGEKCYKTAYGCDEPCDNCPVQIMIETKEATTSARIIEGRSIEITANPALDANGELLGGVMRLEDVTEIHKRDRQIKELNGLMDAILNNTPVCLFAKDPNDDFKYLYWNKAMANYTKVPTENAIGKTDMEVFRDAKDAQHFREDDVNLLKGNKTVTFQEDFLDADGKKVYVNTVKTLIPSDDNKYPLILGVSWDITEFRNIQNALVEAKEKAEENDKSKSQFVANMGHEIRTPINAIVGFSELLTDDTLDEEDKREYMDIIQKNNKLLQQLVSDILDLSKIEARMLEFNYEEVNLNLLCSYLVTTCEMRSDLKVPILYDDTTPQYYVYSDEKRIQQIITNFINNAIKFTNEGSIELGMILRDESNIEIYVKDTGTGIPKDKFPYVFDRFVKLNSRANGNGTGLGLAICKNLAEQLGGRIGAESQEGIGSRFWFTLPYHTKPIEDRD